MDFKVKNMKNLALIFFLTLSLISCKKDKFAPAEIQTLSVNAKSPNNISLTGNVISMGNQTIKDYGFVYSFTSSQLDGANGIKISLGNNPSKGQFAKTLDNISLNSTPSYTNMIWVRTYLTDQNGTIFGTTLSTKLPTPNTNGSSPMLGKAGEIVKFSGKFYNPSISNVVVTFQNVKAKIISASDSEISVEIPKGISASHRQNIPLTLSVGGATANSMSFTILANITDFTPKSGVLGSTITLIGDNLPNGSYYQNDIQIYMDDIAINSNYYTSQITVPFTVNATSKLYTLNSGQKQALPGEFTIISPQITSITPETVLAGQSITVSGSNFPTGYNYTSGRPMIKIGNNSYTNVNPTYNNSFTFVVPNNTPEGSHTLFFKVGPHEVQAPKKLTIQSLSATSFSPTFGAPGKEINITGNFISGNNYYVAFGAINSYGTATSSTNLRVTVPTGLNTGSVKITLDPSNKKIVIPGDFEVNGASFSSFTPISGVAGTYITIKGSDFYPSTQITLVKFGTVNVSPISVTENTIVVPVPSNVAPGAMKLTVINAGQTIMHNDNFTLTN